MAKSQFLRQPDSTMTLGEVLLTALSDTKWTTVRGSVAFAKASGVKHLSGPLMDFGNRAVGDSQLVLGIDQQGSSLEAIEDLFLILNSWGGEVFILRNPSGNPSPTFHPKLWFFTNRARTDALLITGSGNLTEGGLYTNYEVGIVTKLEVANDGDSKLISDVDALFADWTDSSQPHVLKVDLPTLQNLHDSGELPSEHAIRQARQIARNSSAQLSANDSNEQTDQLFSGTSIEAAPIPGPPADLQDLPRVARNASGMSSHEPPTTPIPPKHTTATPTVTQPSSVPQHNVLFITLRPQQKTELYLTKGALEDNPHFFGMPFTGLTTPKKASSYPQPQPDPLPTVSLTVYSTTGVVLESESVHKLKMWIYSNGPSANDDFRLTIPVHMKNKVPNDTILRMERDPNIPELDYKLEFYPPGHPSYSDLLALCTEKVPNSSRRYGWQ